jgi:TonB family protein
VRGRIAATSVGVSLAIHFAIGLQMAKRRMPPQPRPQDHTIEIALTLPPAARTPSLPTPSASTSPKPHRSPIASARPVRSTPQSHPTQETHVVETPAPAAPSSETSRPSSIDLFAPDALRGALSSGSAGTDARDPGGHLRRATDPPPAHDASSERETVAARVHETVGEIVGNERVASGRVSSHWRDVERKLVQSFHPPVGVVKQENVVKALAHQMLRSWLDGPPRVGPVPRGIDASIQNLPGTPEGFNQRSLPLEQALTVQSRWGDPATWLCVEVEITVDEDGRVTGSRVIHPSGRRLFDRHAMSAVEDAVRAAGPPVEHRTVVTRWLVEAALAVAPPTAIGLRFDETGHLNPGASGVRRYLDGVHPLQQRVQTHVALRSIDTGRD